MRWGVWPRIVSSGLGVWLMVAPAALGYNEPAATVDRIVGPLVASCSFIAAWAVLRGLRWLTLPLGVALILAPWMLGYELIPRWNSMVVGALVIALALPSDRTRERYGGGWSALWRRPARQASGSELRRT